MDVRDLAPAMLALGQLFDAANSPLNGDSARVGVHVKATELGLFQITFEVLQTNGALLVSLLSGPTVTAAANLVGLVIGSPAGTERLSVSSGLPQQRQRLSEFRAVQRSCATATESDVQHALREATVLLRGGILKGGNL